MSEYGRHVRAALVEQSGTYRASHDPTLELRLYEQIGTLYGHAERADAAERAETGQQGDEDGTAVQELTRFLEEVHAALRLGHYSGQHAALNTVLRRYAADRGRG